MRPPTQLGADGLPVTSIPKNQSKGCWEFGGCHRRQGCPKFAAELAKRALSIKPIEFPRYSPDLNRARFLFVE